MKVFPCQILATHVPPEMLRRRGARLVFLVATIAWWGPSSPGFASTHTTAVVRLDPAAHALTVEARIEISGGGDRTFSFYATSISKTQVNQRDVVVDTDRHRQATVAVPSSPELQVLTLSYRSVFGSTEMFLADSSTAAIDSGRVYLGGDAGWMPGDDTLGTFRITVIAPDELIFITEGRRLRETVKDGARTTVFDVAYPSRNPTLVGGDFVRHQRKSDGVLVETYLYPADTSLADQYLGASERYLQLYNGLLGPYPFESFAVVDNFFASGYGMPGFTVIGQDVLRLPFIVDTSLGHEVAHNWWGNGVYVDADSGNWCEGLTTFYADYRYEAEKSDSAAAQYRREINENFTLDVSEKTDYPLTQFRSRENAVDAAIGYGKCAMVFAMLQRYIGEERFYRVMRTFFRDFRFREASWDDIAEAFTNVSTFDATAFFRQWVYREGAPQLVLEQASVFETDDDNTPYAVDVTLGAYGDHQLLDVPVVVATSLGNYRFSASFTGFSNRFTFKLPAEPLALYVDPNHEIFRKLDPSELPVNIARVLSADDVVVAMPTGGDAMKRGAYADLATRFSDRVGTVVADTAVTTASDMVVLGDPGENRVWDRLSAPTWVGVDDGGVRVRDAVYQDPGAAAFVAFRHPDNPQRTVVWVTGKSADAIAAAGYKLIYYGKFSAVSFVNGTRQRTWLPEPSSGVLGYRWLAEQSRPVNE